MCCSKLYLGNDFSKKVLTQDELLILLSMDDIDRHSPDSHIDMAEIEADCIKLAEGLRGVTIEVFCRWKSKEDPYSEYLRVLDYLSTTQDAVYRGFKYVTEMNGIEGISCSVYSYIDILDEVRSERSGGANYCYIIPIEACE